MSPVRAGPWLSARLRADWIPVRGPGLLLGGAEAPIPAQFPGICDRPGSGQAWLARPSGGSVWYCGALPAAEGHPVEVDRDDTVGVERKMLHLVSGMVEPSEPASLSVRVKVLLVFFSFRLKFPQQGEVTRSTRRNLRAPQLIMLVFLSD